jgi:enoyl-CoA hydratase
LKLTKESLTGIAADRDLEDNYRWEQGFTLQAYLSPDSVEARKAFAEKRDAKF